LHFERDLHCLIDGVTEVRRERERCWFPETGWKLRSFAKASDESGFPEVSGGGSIEF